MSHIPSSPVTVTARRGMMTINDGNQSAPTSLTRPEMKRTHTFSLLNNKWWNCFLWQICRDLQKTSQTDGPIDQKKDTHWCYLFFLWSACVILNSESGKRGFLPATINKQIPLSQCKTTIWDSSLTDGASPSSAWRWARLCVCVEVCTFCMIFSPSFFFTSYRDRMWEPTWYMLGRTCAHLHVCETEDTKRKATWIHASKEACCRGVFHTPTHPKSLWCLLCYRLLCWFN